MLKPFVKFLDEQKKNEDDHIHGTYFEYVVSPASQKDLRDYARYVFGHITNEIHETLTKAHCTILYSKHPCPAIKNVVWPQSVETTVTYLSVLGEKYDESLVLCLQNPLFKQMHEYCKANFGATHDYPEYIPHVTIGQLGYGQTYKSDIPFRKTIVFDRYNVKPLKP